MKLGIMQPYFMPYIGYFQLMKAVDNYIVYDDVNYIKGGWINRNNIMIGGEKKLFTITLNSPSPNKLINEIEIKDDFRKLMRTLQINYAKAPYFEETIALMEKIINYPDKQLARFIANSFHEILKYLNINTKISLSSELEKDCSLKGKDKVINICKNMNASEYYNAIGGQELYNKADFLKEGIDLSFLETCPIIYDQCNSHFVPYLSMIDVLMFNSETQINDLLEKYKLIN